MVSTAREDPGDEVSMVGEVKWGGDAGASWAQCA